MASVVMSVLVYVCAFQLVQVCNLFVSTRVCGCFCECVFLSFLIDVLCLYLCLKSNIFLSLLLSPC